RLRLADANIDVSFILHNNSNVPWRLCKCQEQNPETIFELRIRGNQKHSSETWARSANFDFDPALTSNLGESLSFTSEPRVRRSVLFPFCARNCTRMTRVLIGPRDQPELNC